jgi:NADPH:quinone reductase-like Zn-dependent oxidoreductase
MRAYVLNRYKSAAELRADVPAPVLGNKEILVRVKAAGLNPVDYKIREGQLKLIYNYPLPIVMGCELAGVVEKCGDGVTRFAAGDRVFVRVDKEKLGAFAELAVVRQEIAAKMPASIDFPAAAGVPLAALTALQVLRDELDTKPGQRLFIPGGAGGVGVFAIQLAKHLGAFVATTASSRGEALVKKLGADVVVDYTQKRFEDELSGYDAAFDLVGGDTLDRAFKVVKRGGLVLSIAGMPEPLTATKDLGRGFVLSTLFWFASTKYRRLAKQHGVRYRYYFMHPAGADLDQLAALIDAKKLEAVVDRIFSFEQIPDAFSHLESGRAKGKVVVAL